MRYACGPTGVSSGTRQDLELGRTTFRMRQIE